MYGGQYGLIFVLGLYLQYNQGLSPTEAGRLIMLQAIIMMVLAPITGRLSDTYRPWLIAATGCLSAAVGIGLILFLNVTESLVLLSISFVFIGIGIGFGLFSTPNNSAAMGSFNKSSLSMASALLTMARLMGQMLGTAIVTLLMSSFIGNSKISPEKYDALLLVLLSMGSVSLLLSLSGFYFCFKNRHEKSSV